MNPEKLFTGSPKVTPASGRINHCVRPRDFSAASRKMVLKTFPAPKASIHVFGDIVKTMSKVSGAVPPLSSGRSADRRNLANFPGDFEPRLIEGQAGKAGRLGKTDPLDAIHATGRTDTH
jgi:hypothetical protein